MKITVTVDTVLPIEERQGANGAFRFRKVWARDLSNSQYPETLEFTFSGSTIDYPTSVEPGDQVEVDYAISGRKWSKEGKEGVFMSLRAWSIRKIAQVAAEPAPAPQQPAPSAQPAGFYPSPNQTPIVQSQQPPTQELPF